MGFKSVYQSLIDVFPQVDSRILKAVSIENSKDADAAVVVVLNEILPFLSEQSQVPNPPRQECSSSALSDGGGRLEEETNLLRRRVGSEKTVGPSELTSTSEQDCDRADVHKPDSICTKIALNQLIELCCDVDADQLQANTESEELILLGTAQHVQTGSSQNSEALSSPPLHDGLQLYVDTEAEVPSSSDECPEINIVLSQGEMLQVSSTSLIVENGVSNDSFVGHLSEHEGIEDPVDDCGFDVVAYFENLQLEGCSNDNVSEVANNVAELTPAIAEDGGHSESSHPFTVACENVKSSYDDKIELLKEMIKAARNNKKTLFSAMESVMSKMRQVEVEEKAAEQAKEEAARGGLDILLKVEEIKQMLAHAKQANDMHAGEVYGEKAILATEARELQGRLLSLGDERDNALSILDEMNLALETRLAVAEEMRMAAEQEKLEKEESALGALAEQQGIIEKVVQESKIIQHDAEENSKLREFLVDRGRVVDTLQGEISVVCQDVKLLKEKFDNRLPLTEAISSSQTSCILASSGSSIRSSTSDLAPMLGSKSSKETSLTCSVNGRQSPKSKHDEPSVADTRGVLVDEDWDFFDA